MEAKRTRYQYTENRTSYVEGNTVRQVNTVPDVRRPERTAPTVDPRREQPSPRRQDRKQPRQLSGINMASLFVLTAAIITTLYFCVEYLQLQYEVSRLERVIIAKEESLITSKNRNDAMDEQINSNYDLDYVYQVAVGELGMVYPNNNTVITYQSSDEGYVRQYHDIPD